MLVAEGFPGYLARFVSRLKSLLNIIRCTEDRDPAWTPARTALEGKHCGDSSQRACNVVLVDAELVRRPDSAGARIEPEHDLA